MQSKISCFFKPCSSLPENSDSVSLFDDNANKIDEEPEILIKYSRRMASSHRAGDGFMDKEPEKLGLFRSERILNKKRKYAQSHLNLGQSDFMLHTCKICGFNYATGDEGDEKLHKEFHKNYTHGLQFKGWRKERVVDMLSLEKGRVILVLSDDPPAQRNKVQEVIKRMEMELGDGWIFHERCKVYLYISSQRVAGCLVAESITNAYHALPKSLDENSGHTATTDTKSSSTALKFGSVNFQREKINRVNPAKIPDISECRSDEMVLYGKDIVPALCGIRAIWVSPSNRRQHIATRLLDAARRSFCADGLVLEPSQLAFSQPTSVGNLLASSYSNTTSFLVYTTT